MGPRELAPRVDETKHGRHVTRGFHEIANVRPWRVSICPQAPRIWGEQGQAGEEGVLKGVQPTRDALRSLAYDVEGW